MEVPRVAVLMLLPAGPVQQDVLLASAMSFCGIREVEALLVADMGDGPVSGVGGHASQEGQAKDRDQDAGNDLGRASAIARTLALVESTCELRKVHVVPSAGMLFEDFAQDHLMMQARAWRFTHALLARSTHILQDFGDEGVALDAAAAKPQAVRALPPNWKTVHVLQALAVHSRGVDPVDVFVTLQPGWFVIRGLAPPTPCPFPGPSADEDALVAAAWQGVGLEQHPASPPTSDLQLEGAARELTRRITHACDSSSAITAFYEDQLMRVCALGRRWEEVEDFSGHEFSRALFLLSRPETGILVALHLAESRS